MASPLSLISNAKLCFCAPGGRGGPETGYELLPGQHYLIRAYLKQVAPNKRVHYSDRVALKVGVDIFAGYIVDWTEMPDGEDLATWEPTSLTDDSGKRPPGLKPTQELKFSFSGRLAQSCESMEVASVFGDEGIGSIIREELGDRMIVKVEWLG